MSRFLQKHEGQAQVVLNLETTAEKNLGKEINMVNGKDLNHLDLVIEAKNNRLKSEFFYIYDYEKFNNCSLLKPNFDIFRANSQNPGVINHTSARYVIHYLTKELKKRFKEIDRGSKSSKSALYDVFKPSLGQFDDEDIAKANQFITTMFPFEGCSYTGERLEDIINKSDWITLILSLRIIWSLLPGAIIPWESFKKFKKSEEFNNFSNKQSFYQTLPIFLPSHNHCCVLFEFLEIFIAIFANDFFVDLNVATDLIFTAGQICFNRDEFKELNSNNDDDLNDLQNFYHKRGSAYYQIFIAYLRSLSEEPSFEFRVLLETFKIEDYPPKPYKPLTQKALTLTVPSDPDLATTNYFKLISNAANATSRIYSSNHTFTKYENKFLDKFEINPHKIVEHFFSKSSKNYLLKFDKTLDFENFKVNNEISELRKNLKNGTLFQDKELISTFISDFNRYGFESQRDNGNNSETFITDTINFNFNSNLENVDNLPVRVSKLEISEWFINAWKYETFLGYLQNTVVLKLTKTIGDCDWLIITSHEKVSTTNRYLTPPSSAEAAVDNEKENQLGGALKDEEHEEQKKSTKSQRKSLLPPISTNNKSSKNPKLATVSAPGSTTETKRKSADSPKLSKTVRKSPVSKADLKRISFPSAPKDISNFEDEVSASKGEKVVKKNKLASHQIKPISKTTPTKPLPAPIIPNQRILTPTQQAAETLENPRNVTSQKVFTPSQQISETFDHSFPPPLLRDSANDNSLVYSNDITSEQFVASKVDINTPQDVKYISPRRVRADSDSENTPRQLPKTPKALEEINKTPATVAPQSAKSTPHPYQQFKQSPPRLTTDHDQGSEALEPPFNKELQNGDSSLSFSKKPPLTSVSIGSTSSFQTPPSPSLGKFQTPPSPSSIAEFPSTSDSFKTHNRFSKLNISTSNMKSSVASATSPITQALPKFFKKSSPTELSKISTSESSGSLAFINDGTAPGKSSKNSPKPSLLENNPELNIKEPDSIPEIPYSPRNFRNSSVSSLSTDKKSTAAPLSIRERSTSSVNTAQSDLDKAISDHRDNFVGDISSTSHGNYSQVFDTETEADTTQDTTKTAHMESSRKASDNLDGLLEEIKESMDADTREQLFSNDGVKPDSRITLA